MTRHRVVKLDRNGGAVVEVVAEHEMGTGPFTAGTAVYAFAREVLEANGGAVTIAGEWWHETHNSWDRYFTMPTEAENAEAAPILEAQRVLVAKMRAARLKSKPVKAKKQTQEDYYD